MLASRAGEALTPALARRAPGWVAFGEAMSASDATTPGTAGILTGLLPHRSGVIANDNVVVPELPFLPAALRAAGFRTGGFVSNPNLRPGTGFERGFEVYERVRAAGGEGGGDGPGRAGEEPGGARRPGRVKTRAAAVTAAALSWLDGLESGDERVFLWVHYMEPHGPYEPPVAERALFPREAFELPERAPLSPTNDGHGGIPVYQQVAAAPGHVADPRDYAARYAAEVRAMDTALEDLLAGLERRGLLADGVLVVTADHGEALAGERGAYFSHENGASRDQVHVPLFLAWPGCEPAAHDLPVSTLDVLPTALPLLGLPVPAGLDGRSLLTGAARPVVSETPHEVSVRSGAHRLLLRADERSMLVDDEADPATTRDLGAALPGVASTLRAVLDEVRLRPPLSTPRTRR